MDSCRSCQRMQMEFIVPTMPKGLSSSTAFLGAWVRLMLCHHAARMRTVSKGTCSCPLPDFRVIADLCIMGLGVNLHAARSQDRAFDALRSQISE